MYRVCELCVLCQHGGTSFLKLMHIFLSTLIQQEIVKMAQLQHRISKICFPEFRHNEIAGNGYALRVCTCLMDHHGFRHPYTCMYSPSLIHTNTCTHTDTHNK